MILNFIFKIFLFILEKIVLFLFIEISVWLIIGVVQFFASLKCAGIKVKLLHLLDFFVE